MAFSINWNDLTPVDQMKGDDDSDTELLRKMQLLAEAYITSFDWCPTIVERYIGLGVGGVIALFLFRFGHPVDGTDEYLWVVEGDVPSAYFVVDDAPNPGSALRLYCNLMDGWTNAVEYDLPLDDVFPVNAPATIENAEMLRTRIKFLREEILPAILH